jgi:hypothetical protein
MPSRPGEAREIAVTLLGRFAVTEMSAGRQYTYDHGKCGFEEENHADM